MKNVIKPLAKSSLIPLGLTAAASAAMQKYIKNLAPIILQTQLRIQLYTNIK